MLLIVQFPIADARPFLNKVPKRPARPDWVNLTDFGGGFLRRFGAVRRRLRGGHGFWPDELFFSSARRTFAFSGSLRSIFRPEDESGLGSRIVPRCAFRRLFCSRTTSVVRLEVGLRGSVWGPPFSGLELEALAEYSLEWPVKPAGYGSTRPPVAPLRALGQYISPLYEHATTKRPQPKNWHHTGRFVVPGWPLLLLEYRPSEVAALPAPTKESSIDSKMVEGAELAFMWYCSGGVSYPYWFLNEDSCDPATGRRIRIGLLRLHAEFQVLRQVLQLFRDERFRYKRGSKAADRFDAYLNHTVRLLSKDALDYVSLGQIQDVIAAESIAEGDDITLLRDSLKEVNVRRQIASNALRYAEKRSSPSEGPIFARLRAALIEQFPNRPSLAMLVSDSLDVNLDTVASSASNLAETAFELMQWARIDREGRLAPLLTEAMKQRPHAGEFEMAKRRLLAH